jgi:hypothetical protein
MVRDHRRCVVRPAPRVVHGLGRSAGALRFDVADADLVAVRRGEVASDMAAGGRAPGAGRVGRTTHAVPRSEVRAQRRAVEQPKSSQ